MVSQTEYLALSSFRSALARFLRFSERTARAVDHPTQYLLLLHVCGSVGRDWSSASENSRRGCTRAPMAPRR